MTARAALAIVVLAMLAAIARSDDDPAGVAFREASHRAVANDPGAVDAFEAIGTARPVTRWTDDAWSEVARLAERAGDLRRARHAHEQVVALGTDDALVSRSRAALARLASTTGAGQWDAIAIEHARLVEAANAGGDPEAALDALEQLVRANPAYPRATQIRLALALGWEREGQSGRALGWYRDAKDHACGIEAQRAALAYARAAIRAGELAVADTELDALANAELRCDHVSPDRAAIADVRASLETAEQRAIFRIVLALVLAALLVGAALVFRRDAGTWRACGRHLARPPIEALFLLPIAIVLVAVAQTGNPLVGNAVTLIAIGGVVIAYLSGAMLEAARATKPITRRRIVLQAAGSVGAVALVAYLAIDRYRVVDLLRETVEHGFAR